MTCVFDPDKALMPDPNKAGDKTATPIRPTVAQLPQQGLHTDRDIAALCATKSPNYKPHREHHWRQPRHQRLNAIERLQEIIGTHEGDEPEPPSRRQPKNRTATASPTEETDPQRVGILATADRMLGGKPQRCSGTCRYLNSRSNQRQILRVVAQRHTDLRDHFQRLAVAARRAATRMMTTTTRS